MMRDRPPSAAFARRRRPPVLLLPDIPKTVEPVKSPPRVSVPTHAALARLSAARNDPSAASWVSSRRGTQVQPSSTRSVSAGRSVCDTSSGQPPWHGFSRLGAMVQGHQRFEIYVPRSGSSKMLMVKELRNRSNQGWDALECRDLLKHANIMQLRSVFSHDNVTYLGLDYVRHTLEEIVGVHLPLEECHIRLIATSVGDAFLLAPILLHADLDRFIKRLHI